MNSLKIRHVIIEVSDQPIRDPDGQQYDERHEQEEIEEDLTSLQRLYHLAIDHASKLCSGHSGSQQKPWTMRGRGEDNVWTGGGGGGGGHRAKGGGQYAMGNRQWAICYGQYVIGNKQWASQSAVKIPQSIMSREIMW